MTQTITDAKRVLENADPEAIKPENAAIAGEATVFTPGYVRYAVFLLTCVYTVNYLDRQVVNIVAEPIKRELHLADWQVGLMSGLAFALLYAFLGIAIARLAERKSRTGIISSSIIVWSGFTALCGLVQNFPQLVTARVCVGIGEAGCTPAAHSLISDYVPVQKRASALAVYAFGAPLGGLFGLLLGGIVTDAFGWRAAFWIAGLPGVIVAIFVVTTLREPRKMLRSIIARATTSATFGQTLKLLIAKPTFWCVCGGASLSAFLSFGQLAFMASFFLRNHHDSVMHLAAYWGLRPLGFLGMALGILSGIGGVFGSLVGGVIADRAGVKDLRGYMIAPAVGTLVSVPVFVAAMMVTSVTISLSLILVTVFLRTLYYGPAWAAVQGVAPSHMRATASSIELLIVNLVGGLGPLLIGALSDVLSVRFGWGDAWGLKWSLISFNAVGLAITGFFWMARRYIREDFVN